MKADEAGIVISGRRWSASDFVRADGTPGPWTSKALEADPLSFKAELGRFLTEFFSPGASVTVHTSGSTGAPKAFAAEKSRMRASARATIAFLGLKPGSTNLLAMPLRFIAGKMVVVRSAECGLNLIPVEPCANPFLEHPEAADLCALTPMQAATVLANPATSRFLLESRAVILGGGPVDEELTAKLQSAKGAVYASYGMTETLSHVALRRLNGPTADAGFRALPGVTISLSALNTLQIDAPDRFSWASRPKRRLSCVKLPVSEEKPFSRTKPILSPLPRSSVPLRPNREPAVTPDFIWKVSTVSTPCMSASACWKTKPVSITP